MTVTDRLRTGPGTGRGRVIVDWLSTTDHKRIGHLYLITSFCFFLAAGVLALVIRGELAEPGLQFVSNEQFNQLFSMHGTIMLLLFATPLFAGFANEIMPLQIGSPDVAFPRMNMLSFWLFLFGGIMVVAGSLTPGGGAAWVGRRIRRCPAPTTRRVSAATCGSWAWRGPRPSPRNSS